MSNLLHSLRVLFVAPQRLHDLMRRAATMVHDLFLRPLVVTRTLNVLRQTHVLYKHMVYPSEDELTATLVQLRERLMAEPLVAEDDVEVALDAMMGHDVAGVRHGAEPAAAAGAPEAGAAGAAAAGAAVAAAPSSAPSAAAPSARVPPPQPQAQPPPPPAAAAPAAAAPVAVLNPENIALAEHAGQSAPVERVMVTTRLQSAAAWRQRCRERHKLCKPSSRPPTRPKTPCQSTATIATCWRARSHTSSRSALW
ncbi:MAG: hypothetical protein EOO41_02410, partial [Methanobacteriota archaeon]